MLLKSLYLGIHLVEAILCWDHVSSDRFRNVVGENDLTLVAFVAPWTESCKALESEWILASAKAIKPLISIDCTIDSEICRESQVISYPAIRVFKNGKRVGRYRGARKALEIVAFVSRASRPIVSIVEKKSITAFKSIDEAVFIANPTPKAEYLVAAFKELAARNHDRFAFGLVTPNSKLVEDIPADCIVCYNLREEGRKDICGESKLDILEHFMESATAPLIGEMTRKNELKYLKSGKSLIHIFALTEDERSGYRELLRPLAKKYEEYLSLVTIDATEYSHMAPSLGLEEGVFPALAVQNPILGQIFPFDQRRQITVANVQDFILDIVQGKIAPEVVRVKKSSSVEHSEL